MFVRTYNRNQVDVGIMKMLQELTEREIEVLRLLAVGYSNIQIAEKLYLAVSTIKAHVQSILYKLKVNNRIHAAIVAAYSLGITTDLIIKTANRKK